MKQKLYIWFKYNLQWNAAYQIILKETISVLQKTKSTLFTST